MVSAAARAALPFRSEPDEAAVARYERRAQAGALASILDAVAQAPRSLR